MNMKLTKEQLKEVISLAVAERDFQKEVGRMCNDPNDLALHWSEAASNKAIEEVLVQVANKQETDLDLSEFGFKPFLKIVEEELTKLQNAHQGFRKEGEYTVRTYHIKGPLGKYVAGSLDVALKKWIAKTYKIDSQVLSSGLELSWNPLIEKMMSDSEPPSFSSSSPKARRK